MFSFVGLHYEKSKFLESQRILEQLYVFEIIVFKENVSESMSHLDFFFVNYRSTYLDECLLKFLGLVYTHLNEILTVLIESIISDPEVSVFTLLCCFQVILFVLFFKNGVADNACRFM
jgi:hypothetical protein